MYVDRSVCLCISIYVCVCVLAAGLQMSAVAVSFSDSAAAPRRGDDGEGGGKRGALAESKAVPWTACAHEQYVLCVQAKLAK